MTQELSSVTADKPNTIIVEPMIAKHTTVGGSDGTITGSCNTTTSTTSTIHLPIRMIGTVVRGYGRGSTELGIPTANLDPTTLQSSCPFDDLPTGIYWGYGRIVSTSESEISSVSVSSTSSSHIYKAAISIGYCPTYGNTTKTVEPHFIADSNDPHRHASCTGETLIDEFYNDTIRLSVVGYIRPEIPFEGLDKLIVAIKNDIQQTEQLSSSNEVVPCTERIWVGSMEHVV